MTGRHDESAVPPSDLTDERWELVGPFVTHLRLAQPGEAPLQLNRERRPSKDYERTEESSESFIHLGMIRLMVRHLA